MASLAAVCLPSAVSSLICSKFPSAETSFRAPTAATPIVRCQALENNAREATSRRTLLRGAGVASLAALLSAPAAEAKDVPLFGIKKKAVTPAVEAPSAAETVEAVASDAAVVVSSGPSFSLAPGVQAGAVLAADVAAFGIASLVVGSITE